MTGHIQKSRQLRGHLAAGNSQGSVSGLMWEPQKSLMTKPLSLARWDSVKMRGSPWRPAKPMEAEKTGVGRVVSLSL